MDKPASGVSGRLWRGTGRGGEYNRVEGKGRAHRLRPRKSDPFRTQRCQSPAAAARRAAAWSPAAAARAEPEKDRGSGRGGEGGREGSAAAERPGPAEQPWAPWCRAPQESRPPAGVGGAEATSPADTASDDVSRRLRCCFAVRAHSATGPGRRFSNLGGGDRSRPLGLW